MPKNTGGIFSVSWIPLRIVLFISVIYCNSVFAEDNGAPKLQFHMHFLKFDSCQSKLTNQELDSLFDSVEKILPWLDGSSRSKSLLLFPGEKLLLRNHPSLALGFSTMGTISYTFGKYCLGHSDGTPLNAVLHFTLSATLTHLYGETVAKHLMDIHEASADHSFSADEKTLTPNSAMDVYNNYVGIEFGSRFKGIPNGRDPMEFFIEWGMKLYQEGKLRAVKPMSPGYDDQRCLIPKEKFQGPPLYGQIAKPLADPRILKYYTKYEIPFSEKIDEKNKLTEKDISAVVNNSDPSQDPLFLKMEQYRASLGTCCE